MAVYVCKTISGLSTSLFGRNGVFDRSGSSTVLSRSAPSIIRGKVCSNLDSRNTRPSSRDTSLTTTYITTCHHEPSDNDAAMRIGSSAGEPDVIPHGPRTGHVTGPCESNTVARQTAMPTILVRYWWRTTRCNRNEGRHRIGHTFDRTGDGLEAT